MKKVWLGLLVGLLPLALACGSTGSAQDNGGGGNTNGAGGGGTDVPLPEYSYDVPCDESKIGLQYKIYSTEYVDGEAIRGALRSTYTSTQHFSWTEVENPLDAVIFSCDYLNNGSVPEDSPGIEYIAWNDHPRGECSINHGVQATGNRVLTACTTVTETVYNKSNPDYDPAEDSDTYSETGYQRVRITGTRVTE